MHSQTIAVDNVTAARLLIELGDWPHAVQVLEAVVALDPSNEEAWFLLGMARRGEGDERAAAAAFRQATTLRPTLPRPWLELGRSLTEIKDWEGAKAAFDEGLRLADNRTVRRNIRKYLEIIDDNRTFSYWVATRMQPDTNPAAASGDKVVNIGGIPYVLNTPQQKQSSIGAGVLAGARYGPWLSDTTRILVEVGYSGIHFLHACCSDDNFAAAVGPAFRLGDFTISPQAYYRYRFYDDKAYSSEQGGRLAITYTRPSWRVAAGAEGGATQLVGIDVPGTVARGFLSADVALTDRLSLGATLRFERDNYPIPSQAFSAPAVELRAGFLGPWELPVNLWAAAMYRAYDGATLTSSGVRADHYWGGGVTVLLDVLTIWGVSPSIGFAYESEASNDPLGRFNRLTGLLGVAKVF